MQKSEVAMLLTYVHSVQGGEATEMEVAGWFETLGHLDYSDAMLAAISWAREPHDRGMKPGDVIARTKAAERRESLNRSPYGAHWVDCEEEGREHRWLPGGTCLLCEQAAF